MLGFGHGRLILSATVLGATALGLLGFANTGFGAALVGESRRVDLGQKAPAGIDALKARPPGRLGREAGKQRFIADQRLQRLARCVNISRWFRYCAADTHEQLPAELIAEYDEGGSAEGVLVFDPAVLSIVAILVPAAL